MTDTAQVLAALRPRGLRERLAWRLRGGLTAGQVASRIDGASDAGVREVLDDLVRRGLVGRRAARLQVHIAGKGARDVLVDVYRLTGEARGA